MKFISIMIAGAWLALAPVLAVPPAAAEDPAPAAGPSAAPQQESQGAVVPPPPLSAPAGVPEATAPEAIEPQWVRSLVKIERNRNDSNPTWTPTGHLIAFERSKGDKKEIIIGRPDGAVVQTIYYQLSEDKGEMKFFFPGVYEEISYNAGISWSPAGDRFVFMSNGGEGNYDLYLRELGGKATTRLTDHKEKDGQAHWSPGSDSIVFVSGRTGKGDVYLMDIGTRSLTRITQGGKPHFYPQWSPEGKRIAMMHGTNENHDIFVVNDLKKPGESLKALTTWQHDDLRPVWSPDGTKIAFYSNYNEAGDPKIWCLVVVAADGSDPSRGEGLAAKVVAADVVADVERGPAWMPDSSRLVYVKNDRHEYNPIYVVDVGNRRNALVRTETKMNHDVSIAADGTIAFRAQVEQWDHIYLMKLK